MNWSAGVMQLNQIEDFRDKKMWRFHNPIIKISETASWLFNSPVVEMSVISFSVSPPAVETKLTRICNNNIYIHAITFSISAVSSKTILVQDKFS